MDWQTQYSLDIRGRSGCCGWDRGLVCRQPRRRSAEASERFRAKACPGLDPGPAPHLMRGWILVRMKTMRQNKNPEPRSDSIGTERALAQAPPGAVWRRCQDRIEPEGLVRTPTVRQLMRVADAKLFSLPKYTRPKYSRDRNLIERTPSPKICCARLTKRSAPRFLDRPHCVTAIFILTRFLHANRYPARIKCGAGPGSSPGQAFARKRSSDCANYF
jgi:hypothetical protein